MKRIIWGLIIISSLVLLLSSCGNKSDNEERYVNKENETVKYNSGVYHNKNWSDTTGTYEGLAVPDKETALKIGCAIFDAMDKSKNAQKYKPQSVFYDEEDGIWIVSFWEPSNDMVLGGDCSIAINKENGEIIRIWFGE